VHLRAIIMSAPQRLRQRQIRTRINSL
jgi:hypothetical protein